MQVVVTRIYVKLSNKARDKGKKEKKLSLQSCILENKNANIKSRVFKKFLHY